MKRAIASKILSLSLLTYAMTLAPTFGQDSMQLNQSAPTNFRSNLSNSDEKTETREVLEESSSLELNSVGGRGRTMTPSIRGSDSASILTSLEGIPLNLPAEGYFNYGDFSSFGLEDAQLIRGGYLPYSTNPQGNIAWSLPRTKDFKSKFTFGSYETLGFDQLSPNASFSILSSKNDFKHFSQNGFERRKSNSSLNINLRAWQRAENYQVWGLFMFSDQEFPLSTSGFGSESESQAIRPLLAYQHTHKNWAWDLWSSFQNRETTSSTETQQDRIWTSGQRLKYSKTILKKVGLESQLQSNQDYISSSSFSSEWRQSLSFNSSLLFELDEGQLIHPRARVEYLSDLDKKLSFHPGIGGRHRGGKHFDLLWNASYISRAPSLFELYYRSPGFEANTDLDRQRVLQFDFGYELHFSNLKFVQSFFQSKITNAIQYNPSTTKTENIGNVENYGIENSLQWSVTKLSKLNIEYTYLVSEKNRAENLYQPRHRLFIKPTLNPQGRIELQLPVRFRSDSLGFSERLPAYWDLSPKLIGRHKRYSVFVQIRNLLEQRQIEREGFPLPEERNYLFSLQYKL